MSQGDALRSLPVPIAGTHATGAPVQGAQHEGRRLLYFARLMANAAGVPVWQLQSQLPHAQGSVRAQVVGPLAYHKIHGAPAQTTQPRQPNSEADATVVRLVWLPEGFVITPRSASAPNGWGMPPTTLGNGTQGLGTVGGLFPQVIINRFKNNHYPDALYVQEMQKAGASQSVLQEIQEARQKGTLRICAAHVLFMDWELLEDSGFGIGIHVPDPNDPKNAQRPWHRKKTLWRAQFKKRFTPEFSEDESSTWYCHRPQYALESDPIHYLRALTNDVRAQVGMPALTAPMRGTEGQLAESPLAMTAYSSVIGHDSYAFRLGYQSALERFRRAADAAKHGENVLADTGTAVHAKAVQRAVQGWKNSPGHYANMIRDWTHADAKAYWPSMDSAIRSLGKGIKVEKLQKPPYGLNAIYQELNPPISPAFGACQIFNSDTHWGGEKQTQRHLMYFADEWLHFPGEVSFSWKNKKIFVRDALPAGKYIHILACREIKENNAVVKLRAVVREVDFHQEQIHLVVLDFDVKQVLRLNLQVQHFHFLAQSCFCPITI